MTTFISIAVPALTFFLLTAVGLDLTRDDFVRVRRQWAVVCAGLVAPIVLLPPIALGLIWAFQPAPEVAAGLLLVAACPIGGISNTYSYLARASTALSVTLTGLSSLFASVTIPAIGRGLELSLGRPFELAAPIPLLLGQLVLTLGLPVALGMWIRHRRPDIAERHRPALQRLAFGGIAVVLLLVIVADPQAFVGGLSTTVPLAAVFVVISALAGWMTAVDADPRSPRSVHPGGRVRHPQCRRRDDDCRHASRTSGVCQIRHDLLSDRTSVDAGRGRALPTGRKRPADCSLIPACPAMRWDRKRGKLTGPVS